MKVLLVDDNEDARFLLRKRLEGRKGFSIAGEAASGEEAVERVTELAPDLVIMDVQMPGIGGVEATRQIKQASPTTAVLAYSAFSDADIIEAMREAGAAGYVLKDAPEAELIMRLQDSYTDGVDAVSR
jgi:DNA-binding NarL/FixJ family response regulator